MFRVLIEKQLNGIVDERIDIKRMKTEKLYELLGRNLMNYPKYESVFDQEGFYEYKFQGELENKNRVEVSVSFFRISNEDEKLAKPPKVYGPSNNNVTPLHQSNPSKSEEPAEERLQEMQDAGLLTKSVY